MPKKTIEQVMHDSLFTLGNSFKLVIGDASLKIFNSVIDTFNKKHKEAKIKSTKPYDIEINFTKELSSPLKKKILIELIIELGKKYFIILGNPAIEMIKDAISDYNLELPTSLKSLS